LRQVFSRAVEALNNLFFVGLQEEFETSSEALIREMNMTSKMPKVEIKKERDQSNGQLSKKKADLRDNEQLMNRAREVNQYDTRLYQLGTFLSFGCMQLLLLICKMTLRLLTCAPLFLFHILAVLKFCSMLQSHPDLLAMVASKHKFCSD
jgi:hypothetical protein